LVAAPTANKAPHNTFTISDAVGQSRRFATEGSTEARAACQGHQIQIIKKPPSLENSVNGIFGENAPDHLRLVIAKALDD